MAKTKTIRQATKTERLRSRAVGISALVIMLMLTVAVTFTVLALTSNNVGDDDGPPVTGGPIVMALPVDGTFNILKEYDGSTLQYNATLKQWRAHQAFSLGAEAGTSVVATYAGTIKSVTSTTYGTTVVLEHANGLSTVFKSLDKNVNVAPGDRVEKGQKIGTVGTTNSIEFTNTPHVRIEVLKDGELVNPSTFIDFEQK